MLDIFSASMVLHDIPKARIMEIRGTPSFVYLRFHGPKGDYRDSYTDDYLNTISWEIRQWVSEGRDVYAYFNNTIGNAFENALTLQKMVGDGRTAKIEK